MGKVHNIQAGTSKKNRHKIFWDVFIIIVFLLFSYFLIHTKYNYVMGDEGTYAFKTRVLVEQHEINLKDAMALSLGQMFFGYIFSVIFGFSFKILHISAYFAAFLVMITFYLLLLQFEIDHHLALIGSLAIFINPMTLKLIDWYLTEPFFLFFFFLAIYLYITGIKSGKARYLYLGAIFATIAIFTRQFGIAAPLALIALLFIARKQLKQSFLHILISGMIPILSLAIFFIISSTIRDSATQHYAGRILFFRGPFNPFNLISIILRDALYTLHYTVVYGLPIFLIILMGVSLNKDYFNRLFLTKPFLLAGSFIFISMGTIIIFLKNHTLMPYLSNIFSIGYITNIFGFNILDAKLASILLTIFTTIGGTIILTKILEALDWKGFKGLLFGRDKTEKKEIALYFIYITALFYFLINTMTTLIYDRYIFPLAILLIFFMLLKCDWIVSFKKTALVVFLIIYAIFIFHMAESRKSQEVFWDANDLLISKGVKPIEICAGLGFGYYYNHYAINELYKDVNMNRPINWHKFHPMANYFISSKKRLKSHPGLELIHTLKSESHFKVFENEVYIFKRKDGYKQPIWYQ